MNEIDRQFIKDNILNVPLSDRERLILQFRFGLSDNTLHTLAETGRLFGITRERARQVEAKALDKVRSLLTKT